MIRSQRFQSNLKLVFTYIFIIFMVLVVFFPVVWIFSSSLNPGDSLFSSSFFHQNMTWSHYTELFQETDFFIWYWNTIKVGTFTSLLTILLVSFTAYSFSRLDFIGKKQGLMGLLVLQMFPGIMNMVALYVLLNLIGLLDTHWGLVLIYSGGAIPYNSWLMKGYLDTIPRSLEEAAIIDGASRWKIFWRIIFPLSLPIISVIAILNFIAPFGDFLFARLILTSQKNWTMAVGLYDFISGQYGQHFTQFAAGALLAALPITIIYLSLQKLMIGGLTKGANKG
ncbi:ABC transporter permease subunit [Iocasia frigidifontis]|uniref:ABC transporter permease subunit n=1 Tax=Iocasia fonsfrigidae TaxID=2682810 RepID=A0A8A7KI04_9FIRM|nr:sugar ABC transporter permease [Iocasia fonsfrigidae]QTL99418.1 ABC transporter permease subunit [Iocasia fonsfrigidae]